MFKNVFNDPSKSNTKCGAMLFTYCWVHVEPGEGDLELARLKGFLVEVVVNIHDCHFSYLGGFTFSFYNTCVLECALGGESRVVSQSIWKFRFRMCLLLFIEYLV